MGKKGKHRAGESGSTLWRKPARRARLPLCLSIAALALAAFPSLAAAVTAQPFFGPVSATPTSDGAHLNATVYPYGLDTTYHFEYGPTTSYGSNVPIPDGDAGAAAYPGTVQVPQTVSGLAGGTYHYRIVAQNSAGTATSSDQTFTTTGNPPTVSGATATETVSGFHLAGSVNPNGSDATYHFEYGTTTAYGTNVPTPEADVGSGSTAVAVGQDIAGLLPNTTYHFRLVAHGAGAMAATTDQTFLTPPSPPAAPSAAVSAPVAFAGGYHLKGAINPNSVDTTYHFEFGTTTAYGTSLPIPDADIGSGSSTVTVSQDVTGLAPNTVYHYRIVANNSKGPGTSADEMFTTAPNPPVVTATPYTETAEGWFLNGTVNPNGGATTYHFDFGITAAYGSSIPSTDVSAGSGTSVVTISELVQNLPPNVPYHYRLVAHNAGGTSTSGDQEFVTPAESTPVIVQPAPPAPAPPAPPAPAPTNRFSVHPALPAGSGAMLKVSVPGPGTLSAAGKKLKTARAGATRAGVVTLKLKLTGAGLKALAKARGHKLKIPVTITFRPTGGSAASTTKTVTFKMAGKR